MAKFTETNFDAWRKPASDHEEVKLESARQLVNKALDNSAELAKIKYEVFGQGSYANDTNVRLNSDIDLNVMYRDEFFYELPTGKTNKDFNFELSDKLAFGAYKDMIERALVNEFGRDFVKRQNKCLRVLATDTREECDVVPTFEFRRFSENGNFVTGVRFVSDEGKAIKGFPKQHTANAIEKNKLTGRSFKRATRIFKRLRHKMKSDNVAFPDSITSFLIECLMWNVPNKIYNESTTWSGIVRESIIYLYNATKAKETCKEWGEVSELLYLFHSGRKWTVEGVNEFLVILWNYLELE
ncbi:nucleotidyltransferase domain-containing protein [Terrimonas pollutisoli]|uniref:nucleotidyltransferase domain-containing protein n=1 Tax=Terrimonas pollutisoli TaxID=3034147 RepID=UPI0023EC4A25|nr:nucleotidyltransferase [Terrimonas sp. H1YJ31]